MSDAFLELLNAADHKAKHFYPKARFCSAEQRGLYDESPWTFTFRVPSGPGKPDTTLQLFYAAGEFTPEHIDRSPLGVRDIPLPVALGLEKAEEILHENGIHGIVTHKELSWPRETGADQPYYMFEMGPVLWFVGLNDRRAHRSPIHTMPTVSVV